MGGSTYSNCGRLIEVLNILTHSLIQSVAPYCRPKSKTHSEKVAILGWQDCSNGGSCPRRTTFLLHTFWLHFSMSSTSRTAVSTQYPFLPRFTAIITISRYPKAVNNKNCPIGNSLQHLPVTEPQ